MDEKPEQLILKPDVTVLLETDEPIMAQLCLTQVQAQKWDVLDARLAGKPGAFQVTCRYNGTGMSTYDEAVAKARVFCHGFVSGWHCRKR